MNISAILAVRLPRHSVFSNFLMETNILSIEEFHELYKLKQNYVAVANSYVQEKALAEDIVTDSYMFLLEKRAELKIENPKSFMLGIVKHKCLDALRKNETMKKVRAQIYENIRNEDLGMLADADVNHQLFSDDVVRIFREQMAKMPELTSSVFRESRINGMTHNEISSKMGIPVRSVTYEISKALKILKKSLGEYMWFALVLCTFKNHPDLS